MNDGMDDEELLATLRQAVRAREAVPDEFAAAGKNAFAWHNIDAELARLTYDSVSDSGTTPGTRAEAASIRALTFTSTHATIELDVARDSIVGQLVPAQQAVISVLPKAGAEADVTADEIGCFSIDPIPAGPFRLRCRTVDGFEISTGWITL